MEQGEDSQDTSSNKLSYPGKPLRPAYASGQSRGQSPDGTAGRAVGPTSKQGLSTPADHDTNTASVLATSKKKHAQASGMYGVGKQYQHIQKFRNSNDALSIKNPNGQRKVQNANGINDSISEATLDDYDVGEGPESH